MRILIAIMCCKHRQVNADVQRQTWIKDIPVGIDYKFFFGTGMNREPADDEVFLDCCDLYRGLPSKVWQAMQWAHKQGYDYVCKVDDDVYVRPERLLTCGFEEHDYIGRYFQEYACGLAYWVSKKAIAILAGSPEPEEGAEDRWAGKTLAAAGIICHNDERYHLVMRVRPGSKEFLRVQPPDCFNDMIAVAEFAGAAMYEPHKIWLESVVEYNDVLANVQIL
jgi:hypothetical protein